MARAGERAQPQVMSVVVGTTTSADQQLMLISDVMWYCNGMRGGENIPDGVLVGGEEG